MDVILQNRINNFTYSNHNLTLWLRQVFRQALAKARQGGQLSDTFRELYDFFVENPHLNESNEATTIAEEIMGIQLVEGAENVEPVNPNIQGQGLAHRTNYGKSFKL